MISRLKHIRQHGPRAFSSAVQSLIKRPRDRGNVLMFHNGRSGSTLFGDMMDQHPDIFWDGETLEKKLHRIERKQKVGFENLYGAFGLDDGVREVEERMKRRAAGRIFGTEMQDYHAKIMGTQIKPLISRLKSKGFDHFIFLERNALRKITSHLVATQRQKFHVGAGERVIPKKVRINPNRIYIGHRFTTLRDALRQYRDFHVRAEAALDGAKILKLRYEDDIQRNPVRAVERACKFLNIPFHQPRVNFGKTTDASLSDVIENYDEVIEHVSASEFRDEVSDLVSQNG